VGLVKGSDLVYRLADGTRPLGVESGLDLLLFLSYARWWADERDTSLWWHLSEADRGLDLAAFEMLRQTAAEDAGCKERLTAFVIDGGDAMVRAIRALADQPAAAMPAVFEEVLALRDARLSRLAGQRSSGRIAELMVAAAEEPLGRVLDPACGVGDCLLEALRRGATELHGIERDPWTAAIVRMRLRLAGAPLETVTVADALGTAPWICPPAGESSDTKGKRPNTIVVDPPWNLAVGQESRARLIARYGGLHVPPGADMVWLQLAHRSLAPSGTAVAMLPGAAGWRRDPEHEARRTIVEKGVVDAYVALGQPKAYTAIEGALWVLHAGPARGGRPSGRTLVADLAASRLAASGDERDAAALLRAGLKELRGTRSQTTARLPEELGRVLDAGLVATAASSSALLADALSALEAQADAPPLLSELRVENLKAFGGPQRIELAPITLLYGQNSAGKSTLLQSLLLLKQSCGTPGLVSQGDHTDAGSFAGLVHRHEEGRELSIGFSFGPLRRWLDRRQVADPRRVRHLDLSFADSGRPAAEHRQACIGVTDLQLRFARGRDERAAADDGPGALPLRLVEPDVQGVLVALARDGLLWHGGDEMRPSAPPRRGDEAEAARLLEAALSDGVAFDGGGLLPIRLEDDQLEAIDDLECQIDDRQLASLCLNRLAAFARGVGNEAKTLVDEMVYLGPVRRPPQRVHDRTAPSVGGAAIANNIAMHLFDNRTDTAVVNEWLARLGVPYTVDVVPVRVGRELVGDLMALLLRDSRMGDVEISPLDVGFGVSQLLPIVVELLAGHERVVLIEQPEIHLHPRLQTELGDLLIQATLPTESANQVIVETHSEHLLLRLQTRIREGIIPADHVAIHYVDTLPEGMGSRVTRLRLDDHGAFLDPWPEGFFDESLDEIIGSLA
jgi:predicted ATPase/16S rRNA G966 N2-methylase RsmD